MLETIWGVLFVYLGAFFMALLAVELRLWYGSWRMARRIRAHAPEILASIDRHAAERRAYQDKLATYEVAREFVTPTTEGEATPVWPADAVERLRAIWGTEPPTPEEKREV